MSQSTTTDPPHATDDVEAETDFEPNPIEAVAQDRVGGADAEGKAIHEENPMLCPPVCLGYAAGAFATGYLATKRVANGANDSLVEETSALQELAAREVSADASVDELLAARTRE